MTSEVQAKAFGFWWNAYSGERDTCSYDGSDCDTKGNVLESQETKTLTLKATYTTTNVNYLFYGTATYVFSVSRLSLLSLTLKFRQWRRNLWQG